MWPPARTGLAALNRDRSIAGHKPQRQGASTQLSPSADLPDSVWTPHLISFCGPDAHPHIPCHKARIVSASVSTFSGTCDTAVEIYMETLSPNGSNRNTLKGFAGPKRNTDCRNSIIFKPTRSQEAVEIPLSAFLCFFPDSICPPNRIHVLLKQLHECFAPVPVYGEEPACPLWKMRHF